MRISNIMCDCTLYDGSQCNRAARYVIDELNLCTQHAGPIAIIKLLAKGGAQKVELAYQGKDPLCNLTTMFDYRRDHNIAWR